MVAHSDARFSHIRDKQGIHPTRQAGVLYVKIDNKESKEIGEADGNLRKSPSED